MVQQEVKKKTTIYGTVAILSAIILISMVYVFGSTPTILPSSQTPVVSNTSPGPGPTITPISQSPSTLGMKTFLSIEELKSYLINNTQSSYSYGGGTLGIENLAPAPAMQSPGNSPDVYWTRSTDDYSTTNIQVAGVDEADTVKTDGQYIYTISNSQNSGIYYGYSSQASNSVYILSADPQNAKVVSKIPLESGLMPVGLFLSPDSSKLVVLANKYTYPNSISSSGGNPMIMPFFSYESTTINVYDISNKANPVLARNFMASGSYFNSRLIGNYLYAVTTQSAMVYNDAVTVPAVYKAGVAYGASPTSIYYADMNQSNYYSFTSFYGINLLDNQQQPTNMTVLMSGASTMYVSPDNIYVAYPNWANGTELTSIYRVKINGLQLTFEAQGSVPGDVINQYAMDQYSGNLRVATNLQQYTMGAFVQQQASKTNNVYVLNQNLTIIGKLEGIGQGENLHAVRFMGDKCYLVTFIKTDPLFVIDLSQPQNPKVLGELKIPGYSDYLHPYDETHLIGVGKEAVAAAQGNFAWYQGLKLALFDVSDVNNPVQLANYVIGDRGTDSAVLNDPKAFLFDRGKNLLVIPVDLAIVNQTLAQQYPSDFPAYGQMVWQGAYVFSLTPDGGFILKGTVTHLTPALLDNQGHLINNNDYWNTQN
ncbi:MAG: beta-propeller domain-containing protein, partial [Candidatus Bathyarchaeota archaeon]|nr:beta-propeller domain-containing protein [Candidatus Bathyarchaeota archaeon]